MARAIDHQPHRPLLKMDWVRGMRFSHTGALGSSLGITSIGTPSSITVKSVVLVILTPLPLTTRSRLNGYVGGRYVQASRASLSLKS